MSSALDIDLGALPVSTRCHFDVGTTLLGRQQRCYNVETTSCVYWATVDLFWFLTFNFIILTILFLMTGAGSQPSSPFRYMRSQPFKVDVRKSINCSESDAFKLTWVYYSGMTDVIFCHLFTYRFNSSSTKMHRGCRKCSINNTILTVLTFCTGNYIIRWIAIF